MILFDPFDIVDVLGHADACYDYSYMQLHSGVFVRRSKLATTDCN